jgi:hypothetical protein
MAEKRFTLSVRFGRPKNDTNSIFCFNRQRYSGRHEDARSASWSNRHSVFCTSSAAIADATATRLQLTNSSSKKATLISICSIEDQTRLIMWQNLFDPPFVLPPKHAALFRIAAAVLSDTVGWTPLEEDWEGTGHFDRLTQGQKQQAILKVAKALLDPAASAPEVTAAIAAAVDAIYNEIIVLVESEMGEEIRIRQMILEALAEINYWDEMSKSLEPGEEAEVPVQAESEDNENWYFLIDQLRETILDDYDFTMEEEFMDMSPETADLLKKNMNIDPDYFVDVIEDPGPERLAEIQRELRSLVY